jgi:hypothetical protein
MRLDEVLSGAANMKNSNLLAGDYEEQAIRTAALRLEESLANFFFEPVIFWREWGQESACFSSQEMAASSALNQLLAPVGERPESQANMASRSASACRVKKTSRFIRRQAEAGVSTNHGDSRAMAACDRISCLPNRGRCLLRHSCGRQGRRALPASNLQAYGTRPRPCVWRFAFEVWPTTAGWSLQHLLQSNSGP